MCRPCHSIYQHEHYSKNKERYIEQARERKGALAIERTEWLLTYFKSHPCTDCGEADRVVLEFDHRRDKQFNIGAVLPYRRWDAVLEEIANARSYGELPSAPDSDAPGVGPIGARRRA